MRGRQASVFTLICALSTLSLGVIFVILSAGVPPTFMLLMFSAIILALGLAGWALGIRKSLQVGRVGVQTSNQLNRAHNKASGRPHLVAVSGAAKKPAPVKRVQQSEKKKSPAEIGRKEFFLIIHRLKDVAKTPWLNDLKRGRAGRRLRLAILSWHEDLMSDVPLFDAKIGNQDFRGFSRRLI